MDGAGGIVGDEPGKSLGGLTRNIGISFICGAEMWGVKTGLELGKIILEVDSEVVDRAL